MQTSCSRMAFCSVSVQQLSEIAVTFQLQTCRESANPQHRGCSCIPLHTRTSRLGLSRFRNDRCCHRRSERSADMKTSLAIVLATIALTFGAMLSFTSGVAAHDYGNLSGKSPGSCGVVA